VAVVAADAAGLAVDALRSHPLGRDARLIGSVKAEPPGMVLLKTQFGGTRVADLLVGDPLPRIC
jgi:hydrogenase expression/formation protein HypE